MEPPPQTPSPTGLLFEKPTPYGPVPTTSAVTTADALRRQLIGSRYVSAAHIAVVDEDGRLVGVARIEDVLAAEPDIVVGALMDVDAPVIVAGVDEEVAAWKAVRHGESALAVLDDDGRFVGFVPPRRIVEVLLGEHDEDLARLGGYLASTSSARHAIEEPVVPRLVHRLPWLLLGLAGAIAAAGIVGAYERELARHVLLASFVPGVVYMADAVGTQTEALVIRGLSVGVPVGRIIRRELLTGLLVGVSLASVFLLVGRLLWDESDVVVAVAIAIFAACSTATLVAMALPWGLSRLGSDPAFGSGPLATVIQDLLSLVIYFWVASVLVT
ncbi:MAG: magnesium transporter [Acidimicrobiia bacterium]